MTILENKLYSVEEFMAMPDDPDGMTYELVDGELIRMQGPNAAHVLVAENLQSPLGTYVRQNKLGRIVPEANFAYLKQKPRTVRRPDLAFVPQARLATIDVTKPFQFVPDLTVEVISPSDKMDAVFDKVREYLHVGVKLVWVVQPSTRLVFVFHPATGLRPQSLTVEMELSGEDVIKGFAITVADIFEGIPDIITADDTDEEIETNK